MSRVTSLFSSWQAEKTANKDVDAGPPANGKTTKSNPIYKSIEMLTRNFVIGRMDGHEFVAFGLDNDMPTVLDKLSLQSPTHRGILGKKAKMVVGKGIPVPEGNTKIKTLFENINGDDYGFNKVFRDAAVSYEKYGAIPYIVKLNNEGKLIGLRVESVRSVRAGVPNDRMEITYWVYKRSFKNTHTRLNEKAKRIPTYKTGAKSGEFMVYVKNPESDNPFYGVPSYVAAYYYITGDFEFGKHIDNAVKNGFSPSVVMSTVGRQMTQEQKESVWDKLGAMFTGSDGLKYMINFVRNKDDIPKIDVVEAKNLDKTIAIMSELNDSKILTAHAVTSPTLFGIQVAGKLGGTGEELLTAYYTFRATETIPNREVILDPVMNLLRKSYGIKGWEVEEEPIEAIIPNIMPVIGTGIKSEEPKKKEDDGSDD